MILISKKTTVQVAYDEDRLAALTMYLGLKESSVEQELVKALDTLCTKQIPNEVRAFLDMKSGVEPAPARTRRSRASREEPADTTPAPAEDAAE